MQGRIQIKIENYLEQPNTVMKKLKFVSEKREFGPCNHNHTLLMKI